MRNRRLSTLLVELEAHEATTRSQAAWSLAYRKLNRGRLSRRQRSRALSALARHARTDPDVDVRRQCVHAFMWQAGWPGVTRLLVDCTKDSEPEVRGQALEALALRWAFASMNRPQFSMVDSAIGNSLTSTEPVVRFWAVYAAGQLNLERYRAVLESMIDDTAVGFADLTIGDEAKTILENLGRDLESIAE